MQANSIWAGNDYAFYPNSGRSERFSLKCYRVKVIRTRQVTPVGAKRATTIVDVHFLDRDTGEVVPFESRNNWYYRDVVAENEDGSYAVRAYDFIEFWEQVDSQYHFLKKKQKQEIEEREQRERERQAELERQRLEKEMQINRIKQFFADKGIDPELLRMDTYGKTVIIRWEQVERAIDKEVMTSESGSFTS